MDGVVVIGREPCETSAGPIESGTKIRLPLVEALTLTQANKVMLADFHEQQEPPKPKRGRYRRRDLRAEK